MIELSGTLSGKVYNQEVVSPDEFARLIGAPQKKDAQSEHVLELCPHLIKVDSEGQEKYPRSVTQNCQTTLYINGDMVAVRYYRQKTPVGAGQFSYTPAHIEFKGKTNSFTQRDYEQFLFFYSSPLCANSPSASQDPMFQYHDPAAIERAAEAKSKRLEDMLEIIQKAPATDIIAKSRGITVRGQGTNVPQGAGVGLHRASLIELLVRFPEDFEREWASDSVLVRGLAREAMYKSAVKTTAVGNRQAWVWSSNNNTIVFIPQDADPFTELVSWCTNAENTEFAKSALTLAVSGQPQRTESTPKVPVPASMDLRHTLEVAAEKGLIWREEGTNRILYQGASGPVETRSYSGGDWIGDLEKFLRIVGKQAHVAAIKAALNNQ